MSGDPPCTQNVPNAVPDLRKLGGHEAWVTQTNDKTRLQATYCQAKREFTAWFQRSGKSKLWNLLDQIRAGVPFDEVYGPLAIPPGHL